MWTCGCMDTYMCRCVPSPSSHPRFFLPVCRPNWQTKTDFDSRAMFVKVPKWRVSIVFKIFL
jgi:hypothetical protein